MWNFSQAIFVGYWHDIGLIKIKGPVFIRKNLITSIEKSENGPGSIFTQITLQFPAEVKLAKWIMRILVFTSYKTQENQKNKESHQKEMELLNV